MSADPPVTEGITTLEALRRTVREELLEAGDRMAGADTPLGADPIALESLANAYVRLGGDLELVKRPADVDAALGRLVEAAGEVHAEDFPPRLAGVRDRIAELGEVLDRHGLTPRT